MAEILLKRLNTKLNVINRNPEFFHIQGRQNVHEPCLHGKALCVRRYNSSHVTQQLTLKLSRLIRNNLNHTFNTEK
jgi:hypothetical protein